MPRSHARLKLGAMSNDLQLRELPPHAKLLYAFLLQDAYLNPAGVITLNPQIWAEDLGLSSDEFDKALAELTETRFVVIDDRTRELLVRTFIRNDGIADQPNMLKQALSNARLIRSSRLRHALAAELRRLAPRRPDKRLANGRIMVYPDPHACADEIDSPGEFPPPGKGTKSPSEKPSGNPSDNPSENPPDSEPFREPFAEPTGEGDGEYLSTRGNQTYRGVRLSRAHARPSARGPSPAELAATATTPDSWALIARWRSEHDVPYRHATYRRLASHVRDLLATNAHPELITDALHHWDQRDNAAPGLLPHLYDDAVRATRARHTPPGHGRTPSTGERVRAALDLADRLEQRDREQPAALRVIEGSA